MAPAHVAHFGLQRWNNFGSYRPQRIGEFARILLSGDAADAAAASTVFVMKKWLIGCSHGLDHGEQSGMVRPGLEAFPATGPQPSAEGGEKSPGQVQRQP
ncbi:hypothetical protein [Streptosporangium roseum]|uniref:hypothetical protein n=1 Tax=Streptosporangium roseum TaxID=2001 RepID=UPI00332E7E99